MYLKNSFNKLINFQHRVRQLDITDRVRDISSAFGLRHLLYIVMIQLVLLEKIDSLVNGVAAKACGDECVMTFISFFGYFLVLWYFSYQPFKAASEVNAYKRLYDLVFGVFLQM